MKFQTKMKKLTFPNLGAPKITIFESQDSQETQSPNPSPRRRAVRLRARSRLGGTTSCLGAALTESL